MPANVERDLKLLKGYALLSSLLIAGLALSAFTRAPQKARFEEIDVGRINVVEKDGTLRLVISNREQSPGPMYKGKPFGYPGGGRPGLIFFNEEGTEDGGLTWEGKTENGKYQAGALLAFDQYDTDQIVVLQYQDNNGQRYQGLTFGDRAEYPITRWVQERDSVERLPDGPEKEAARKWLRGPRNGQPLFASRAYIGRSRNKDAKVELSDAQGRPRLRLVVDSLGAARMEFLDEAGRVSYQVPDRRR
jgi:hypothetical protein